MQPTKFEVELHSNMTLKEAKNIIGSKINPC